MRSRRSRRTAAPNRKPRRRRRNRIRAAATRQRHHEAEMRLRSNGRLGSRSTNPRHIAGPAKGPAAAAQTGNTDHSIKRLGNHSSNQRHMANTSNESGSCYTKPSRLPARRSNGLKPSGHRSGFIAVRYRTPAATRTERSNIISWRKQNASPASVAVRAAKHIPASRYSRERGRRSALPYRLRSCSAYHALPHPQSKPKDMRPYPEAAATAAAAHASSPRHTPR